MIIDTHGQVTAPDKLGLPGSVTGIPRVSTELKK